MKLETAFLIGLAGGVVLGVIFATRPGRETRDSIRRKALDGVDEIASAAGKVGAKVKDAAVAAKEQVDPTP
jgi:hypothetical protein